MLFCRKPVNEHHLGGHSITPLDMADVIPLNPAGWGGQVQKLGKIFRGQSLLLLTLLGAEKFEVCIALH